MPWLGRIWPCNRTRQCEDKLIAASPVCSQYLERSALVAGMLSFILCAFAHTVWGSGDGPGWTWVETLAP